MANVKTKRIIGLSLIFVLLLLLYFPTFKWLVNSWLYSPYYSHGFLVPPISGFIIWIRRHQLRGEASFHPGIWVLFAGLVLYVGGFLYASQFLSAISLMVVLPGLILYFWGRQTLRTFAFPLCFLVFMVPLPFLDKLALWMQSLSARSSASIISLMGIPIIRTGAELRLENAAFVIGVACSGMNSLISLLALAALFAYILRTPFYKKAILFALAFPVAIFANLLRLVSLLLIGNHWGTEAAMGFLHGFFSPLYFVVSIICLVLLAKLLGCSFREAAKGNS